MSMLPFTDEERNERAAALVTSYGVGTHSYNNSAEKREMDRQRKAVTEKYEAGPHAAIEISLLCHCSQRRFSHELSVHAHLLAES